MTVFQRAARAAFAALAIALSAGAAAAIEVPPGFTPAAAFTPDDRALIQRLERYMNTVKTISSEFVQISTDGVQRTGQVSVERPGKVRFEYAPPTPVLIVANYGWVNYLDTKLETVSTIPVSSTPLEILLDDDIRFDGDVQVIGLQRGSGSARIALVQSDDPDEGMVVLTFYINPDVKLHKWTIVNPDGRYIHIALFNAKMNGALDQDLFEFRNPKFFKNDN